MCIPCLFILVYISSVWFRMVLKHPSIVVSGLRLPVLQKKQVRGSLLCPSLTPTNPPERIPSYPVLAFRIQTHNIHHVLICIIYIYIYGIFINIQHQYCPTDPKCCPTAGCYTLHLKANKVNQASGCRKHTKCLRKDCGCRLKACP